MASRTAPAQKTNRRKGLLFHFQAGHGDANPDPPARSMVRQGDAPLDEPDAERIGTGSTLSQADHDLATPGIPRGPGLRCKFLNLPKMRPPIWEETAPPRSNSAPSSWPLDRTARLHPLAHSAPCRWANAKGRRDQSQRPSTDELPGTPVPHIEIGSQIQRVCSR
jgi:hypothetical protein